MGRRTTAGSGGQVSCCVFDLETTNLDAAFGVILCGVVKPAGRKALVFRGDDFPAWKKGRSDDSEVLKAIVAELEKHDIWVAHNGNRFDVPYLRTRLLKHGLPPLATRKLIDPVLLARNKLRLSFNSLDRVANHLGCNAKTEVDPNAWLRASLDGDRKSMDYIVRHCVADVETLERVVGALKAYSGAYNTYGSGF